MRESAESLLEREQELATFAQLIEAVGAGTGQALVVEGPAGIGKTRLLQAARTIAEESGFLVLSARGGELERDLPFAIVRQLFEPILLTLSEGERGRLLEGAAGLAAPVIGAATPGAGDSVSAGASFGIVHGLYWLTSNLASTRPLMLVVDDAHWADAASLQWLVYLVRRLPDLRVLLVVARRPAEPGADADLLHLIMSDVAAHRINPPPLSATAIADVVRALLDADADDELCSACHAVTGGNPLLVRELAGALAAEGPGVTAEKVRHLAPGTISRSVLWRLAALSPGALELAKAAAVLGRDAALAPTAALAGLAPEQAVAAADALAAADIFAPGRPLRFVHPVVRTAIYADIPEGERGVAHRRAARLLTEAGAPPEDLAPHLLASEALGDPWTVAALRAAAAHASRRGASEAAAAYLRRALEEPPGAEVRAEILLELGAAEALMSAPDAVEHLTEAHRLLDDPRRRGAAVLHLGRALMMWGRLGDAIDAFSSAIDELGDADREISLRLEAELIGAARLDITKRAAARDRLARVGVDITGAGPAERLVLANLAFENVVRGEPAGSTAALAERALGDGRLLAEETSDSPVYYLAAWTLALSDRLQAADHALTAALADARSRGSVLGFTIACCFRSDVSHRLGRVAEAEADARAVLAVEPEHRWQLGLPLAVAFLVNALLERGEIEEAAAALQSSGLPEDLPDFTLFIPLLHSRGNLRAAQGDVPRGIADQLLCGSRAKAWGSRNPTFLPWRSAAALNLAGLGEADQAQALADEELELARAAESRRATGIALRTNGLLAGGDRGVELLEEGVAALEPTGARLELARTLVDLGAMLRRQNRRAESREPLRAGLDLATRAGASALVARARDELAAAGARPRSVFRTGTESLTASERRVAQLAADGLSNREIAQALFVTIKTVEKHLAQCFAKLGVSSRKQLVSALQKPAAEERIPTAGAGLS